jgi:PBP1b-binding outer membrane lipoprotein LpoB
MMYRIIILSLSILFIFISCNSEEKKQEPKQMQRQQNILPPQKEKPIQLTKQANIDPQIEAELIAVIKENVAATAAEDKERVLNTIAQDSPQRRSTINGMDYVFANFDMEFNLEEIEVLEVTNDEAKVYYMQTTRAIKGEGFAPTRATGIHILKKENGNWKIFKTEYLGNEQIM